MTSARAHTTAAAVDGRRPALGQGTGRPVGSIHPLGGLSYPVLSCPVQERHRLLVAASPRFAAPQKSIAFIGGHGSLTSEPSLPVCQKTYRVSACRSCGALVPLPFPLHVKPRSLPTSPALLLSFALPPLNILAAVPYRRALASGWALTPA